MEDQVSLWFKLSNEEIMDHSKYRNINTKYAQREITTINHYMFKIDWLIDWLVFNDNFSSMSAISWRESNSIN
jgi:hypothetical protein